MFQCMYSGLSDECIPLVDEYFPDSKKWFNSMHDLVPNYKRIYTKDRGQVLRTGSMERMVFWAGSTLGLPINFPLALIGLVARDWSGVAALNKKSS